ETLRLRTNAETVAVIPVHALHGFAHSTRPWTERALEKLAPQSHAPRVWIGGHGRHDSSLAIRAVDVVERRTHTIDSPADVEDVLIAAGLLARRTSLESIRRDAIEAWLPLLTHLFALVLLEQGTLDPSATSLRGEWVDAAIHLCAQNRSSIVPKLLLLSAWRAANRVHAPAEAQLERSIRALIADPSPEDPHWRFMLPLAQHWMNLPVQHASGGVAETNSYARWLVRTGLRADQGSN